MSEQTLSKALDCVKCGSRIFRRRMMDHYLLTHGMNEKGAIKAFKESSENEDRLLDPAQATVKFVPIGKYSEMLKRLEKLESSQGDEE